MEFLLNRKCAICGAAITDDNPDGIGWGCRKAYMIALRKIYCQVDFRKQRYYSITNDVLFRWFYELHKNVKFRSEFKRNFFNSIVEQYNTKYFISYKQKMTIENWLFAGEWPKMTHDQYENYRGEMRIAYGKQELLVWNHLFTEEEHRAIINYAGSIHQSHKEK